MIYFYKIYIKCLFLRIWVLLNISNSYLVLSIRAFTFLKTVLAMSISDTIIMHRDTIVIIYALTITYLFKLSNNSIKFN